MERKDMNKWNYEAPKVAVVLLKAEGNLLTCSFESQSDSESVGINAVGDGDFWNP